MNAYEALIYTMVATSAADSEMTDAELMTIRQIVDVLPVFVDFNADNLPKICADCAEILMHADGFEDVLDKIASALPSDLYETAYALAVEVAAADLYADEAELNMLQMLRHKLEIDRLIATGIERGARARFTKFS